MGRLDTRLVRTAGVVALIAVMIALPFFFRPYLHGVLIGLLINVIVVVSYRLITTTGEWSLGHVVIMGVGGYASALLMKDFGWSFWASVPAGGAIAALIAYLLSFPLFRMKGFYFLIGSFAAGEAIRLTWQRFRDPFGGAGGLNNLFPPFVEIPGLGEIDLLEDIPYYQLTLAVTVVALWLMYRLERSRVGLTLHAIHWQDVLAESVGVDTRHYRTLAFVTASFFAGIAGALLAHHLGTINPNQFSLSIMLYVLVWVIVGGAATFAGPIIGVTVLTVVDTSLRNLPAVGEHRPLIYGFILIFTVLFLPDGLETLPAKAKGWLARLRPGAASSRGDP